MNFKDIKIGDMVVMDSFRPINNKLLGTKKEQFLDKPLKVRHIHRIPNGVGCYSSVYIKEIEDSELGWTPTAQRFRKISPKKVKLKDLNL